MRKVDYTTRMCENKKRRIFIEDIKTDLRRMGWTYEKIGLQIPSHKNPDNYIDKRVVHGTIYYYGLRRKHAYSKNVVDWLQTNIGYPNGKIYNWEGSTVYNLDSVCQELHRNMCDATAFLTQFIPANRFKNNELISTRSQLSAHVVKEISKIWVDRF